MKNIILTGTNSGIRTLASRLKSEFVDYNLYDHLNLRNIKEPCIISVDAISKIPQDILNNLKSSLIVHVHSKNEHDIHFQRIVQNLNKKDVDSNPKTKECICSGYQLLHFGCDC